MKLPSRGVVTSVLDLAGLAGVVTGVWFIYYPAAIITGGIGLLLLSWRAS